MPRKNLDHLISQLNDALGDDQASEQARRLVNDMQQHVSRWDATSPQGVAEAARALAAELEAEHPQAMAVVRKILETLTNMGI